MKTEIMLDAISTTSCGSCSFKDCCTVWGSTCPVSLRRLEDEEEEEEENGVAR